MSAPPADLVRRVLGEVTEALVDEQARREASGEPRLVGERREALASELVREALERENARRVRTGAVLLEADVEDAVCDAVLDRVCDSFGFTRPLADPEVEEVVFNSWRNVWIYYADGTRRRGEPVAESPAQLVEDLRMLAGSAGRTERRFDAGQPRLNLRLPDGSRLFAIMEVTGESPAGAIRRNRYQRMDLDQLVRLGTIDGPPLDPPVRRPPAPVAPLRPRPVSSGPLASLLRAMVLVGMRVLITGETGSGKTALLRCLLAVLLGPQVRVVAIEDTAELDVAGIRGPDSNTLELEVRQANVEGVGGIDQRDLVRDALRLRPDWLIVSECRGPEAVDMLTAMSHGQRSLSTLHTTSAYEVADKLALYCLSAPERLPVEATHLLVSQSVDFVIHMRQLDRGRRVVSEVLEVEGFEAGRVRMNTVFSPGPDGQARPAGQRITQRRLDLLVDAGFDHTLLVTGGNGNGRGRWGQ